MTNKFNSTNQPAISTPNNQDIELKAQSLVLEQYLARMSQILLKEKCYSSIESFESNTKIHRFILQDTVNILRQLQGNHYFQNTVVACLRDFDLLHTFDDEIYFNGINLKDVNLDKIEFLNASFEFADLENTSVQTTYFENCSFNCTNLTNANFQHAILKKSNFQCAIIHNTDFEHAFLEEVDLKDVDLSGALNLCLSQVIQADNWQYAKYEPLLQAEIDKYINETSTKTEDRI